MDMFLSTSSTIPTQSRRSRQNLTPSKTATRQNTKQSEPRLKRTRLYGPQKTWEKLEEADIDEQDELPF